TEVGEEEVAGRLDRRHFGLVFDAKLENVAVPIEVLLPYLRGDLVDPLPCPPTEFRLVPRLGRQAWDAEVDARHLLGSPQLGHAGKSSPGPFTSARVAIDDPGVANALTLQPERGR